MDKPKTWDKMTEVERRDAYDDAYHLAEFANDALGRMEGKLDELCEAWLKYAVAKLLTADEMLEQVETFINWYEGEEVRER